MAFTELEGANRSTPPPAPQPSVAPAQNFGESLRDIPAQVQQSPQADEAARTAFLRGLIYHLTGGPDNLDPSKGIPRDVSTSELSPLAKSVFDKMITQVLGLNAPTINHREWSGLYEHDNRKAMATMMTHWSPGVPLEDFWRRLNETTAHEALHGMDFGVSRLDNGSPGISNSTDFQAAVRDIIKTASEYDHAWGGGTQGQLAGMTPPTPAVRLAETLIDRDSDHDWNGNTPAWEEWYAQLPTMAPSLGPGDERLRNFYSWILNERARPAR